MTAGHQHSHGDEVGSMGGIEVSPGQVIHRWLVREEAQPAQNRSGKRRRRWVCRCDCGVEKIVLHQSLSLALRSEHGGSRSCGCLARQCATKHANNTKGRPTPEYVAWIGAKKRCYNPRNPSYAWYGQRGIRMSLKWRGSFQAFLQDMGPKPDPGCSLDRVDPDGHYEAGNCRWATADIQARNRRNTRWYHYQGERLILAEVASRIGVTRDQARSLERRGLLRARRIDIDIDKPAAVVIDLNDVVSRRAHVVPSLLSSAA